MLDDPRPYWAKKLYLTYRRWYCNYFLRPRCLAMGPYHLVMKPWYVNISGPNISIGKCFTAIAEPMHRIEIGVWGRVPGEGRINIGDAVLISPGVRISASDEVTIGDGVMLANGCYITDSDWHTVYDRNQRSDTPTPVFLGRNVWLGDHVTVLKGVTIGENTVVGAGSVVTQDLPANVVAGGNPARIVKQLDPQREITHRMDLYQDPPAVEAFFDKVDREVLAGNGTLRWLWGLVYPAGRR